MIFDINIDSVADVLAIRAKAMEAFKAGAVVVSWSVEGSSANSVITMPVKEVLNETASFLKQADPDLYGRRVIRTFPVFAGY